MMFSLAGEINQDHKISIMSLICLESDYLTHKTHNLCEQLDFVQIQLIRTVTLDDWDSARIKLNKAYRTKTSNDFQNTLAANLVRFRFINA